MAQYLVTGGCGFIGSNIVQHLVEAGAGVRVLDDLSTGRRENLAGFADGVELVVGSVTDDAVLARALEGVTCVMHQAALPSVQRSVIDPVESNRINVEGTVRLLHAAVKAGVKRVVYAASSSAYGDQPALVKTEKLLPMPKSPYAVGKLAAEHYLAAFYECYGLETVSLRYFNVFGPRQDPNSEYSAVIPLFVTRILRGQRPVIYGDGQQTRDFTFVENNARANLLAAGAPAAAGQMMNIACGKSYSLLDLIAAINAALGTSVEPVFEPGRPGDVKHSLADISRAKQLIGYEVSVDFNEGLRRTVEWYRKSLGL